MPLVRELKIPHGKTLIIRTSGEEEIVDFPKGKDRPALIGAEILDFVPIGNCLPRSEENADLIMAVDDNGYETKTVRTSALHVELVPIKANKPPNKKATKLYLDICKPGTQYTIVGDVFIVHDNDPAV